MTVRQPEIDAIVAAWSASQSVPRLAEQFQRSRTTITKILVRAGIHVPTAAEASNQRHHFSDEDERKIVAEYCDISLRASIGQRWSLPDRYIYRILQRHGISPDHRTHTLREDAFDLPISPEAAYWAGFLMADGSITENPKRGPVIELNLAVKDREAVEQFAAFVGASHPITTRHIETGDSCRVQFRSQRMADALAVLGVAPRKTNREHAGDAVASSTDFWRGYFDGDGFYHAHLGKYPTVGICGSLGIIAQWTEFLSRVIGVTITCETMDRKGIHETRVNGLAAVPIIRSLSVGYPFLQRKRAAGSELLALAARTYNENGPGALAPSPS